MTQTTETLKLIKSDIHKEIKKGSLTRVVFDLDSTLFNVAPRFSKIIEEFCSDSVMRRKYARAIEILSQIQITHHPYYLKQFMLDIGLNEEPQTFYKEIFEYWRSRFFNDKYVIFDEPEVGAVEFVDELYKQGVHIIYLTGRDEPRMKIGTLESLKKWNFPVAQDRAELVLKPYKELDDAEFKRDHFQIFPPNEKIWFFENEPVNIHLVLKDCPHVKIIYFDSVHSGKAPAPEGLPTIKNFKV
jgi:AAA15 family ATPase/GTPase